MQPIKLLTKPLNTLLKASCATMLMVPLSLAFDRGEMLEKFDSDGNGELSAEERKEARTAMRQHFLGKHDTDGDGELSEVERKAAKAAMRQRFVEKHDTDGDGELSEEERRNAKEQHNQKLLSKFDANGDGSLSKEERAEARKQGDLHRPHHLHHHNGAAHEDKGKHLHDGHHKPAPDEVKQSEKE